MTDEFMRTPQPLTAADEVSTHSSTRILRIAPNDGVKDAFMLIVNDLKILGTTFGSLMRVEPITWNRLSAQVPHNLNKIAISSRVGDLQMKLEIWLNGHFSGFYVGAESIECAPHFVNLRIRSPRRRECSSFSFDSYPQFKHRQHIAKG